MRVAVTGAFGFIGSHLVDMLVQEGDEVVAIDNMTTGKEENLEAVIGASNLEVVKVDLLDSDGLKGALHNVDAVVHLAATVGVAESIHDPEPVMRNNVEGTLKVLNASVAQGIGSFVFASSAAVYGNSKPPLREDSPIEPLSPYAASKVAGEAYCRAFSKSYGLGTIVLRLFNVYGPRATRGPYSAVMTQFASAIREGRPLTIFGDGRQTRDFVYVEDVARAITQCLRKRRAKGDVFNIGTGKATSVNSLARIFLKYGKPSSSLIHAEKRPGEVRHSWAVVTQAKRGIGYEPKVDLEKGVELYVSWFLNG
jgi:UDP-glucose 4-epimerase